MATVVSVQSFMMVFLILKRCVSGIGRGPSHGKN